MKKVLIVDDQTYFCSMAREILSKCSRFRVTGEAYSASEAMDMIDELKPDVVLMDVEMDGINGLEATHLIQAKFPDLPVVLMSIYDEGEYSRLATKVGARGFIPKREFSAPVLADLLAGD